MGVVHACPRGTEQYSIGSSQFLGEPHDVDVAGEPVVVEFFEPRPAYGKTTPASSPTLSSHSSTVVRVPCPPS